MKREIYWFCLTVLLIWVAIVIPTIGAAALFGVSIYINGSISTFTLVTFCCAGVASLLLGIWDSFR